MFDFGEADFSVPNFHTIKGGIALQRQAIVINLLDFKKFLCWLQLKKKYLETLSKIQYNDISLSLFLKSVLT